MPYTMTHKDTPQHVYNYVPACAHTHTPTYSSPRAHKMYMHVWTVHIKKQTNTLECQKGLEGVGSRGFVQWL